MSNGSGITIAVRLYSILRQRDGRVINRLELKVPSGSRVIDILRLLDVPEDLELVLALNNEVTNDTAELHDGDLLAIIPAVAGGASGHGLDGSFEYNRAATANCGREPQMTPSRWLI